MTSNFSEWKSVAHNVGGIPVGFSKNEKSFFIIAEDDYYSAGRWEATIKEVDTYPYQLI